MRGGTVEVRPCPARRILADAVHAARKGCTARWSRCRDQLLTTVSLCRVHRLRRHGRAHPVRAGALVGLGRAADRAAGLRVSCRPSSRRCRDRRREPAWSVAELPPHHRELVPQHKDLGVLIVVAAGQQAQRRGHLRDTDPSRVPGPTNSNVVPSTATGPNPTTIRTTAPARSRRSASHPPLTANGTSSAPGGGHTLRQARLHVPRHDRHHPSGSGSKTHHMIHGTRLA
jgi:hypothetical protein